MNPQTLQKIESLVNYILDTESDDYNEYLQENESGEAHVYELALAIRSELNFD